MLLVWNQICVGSEILCKCFEGVPPVNFVAIIVRCSVMCVCISCTSSKNVGYFWPFHFFSIINLTLLDQSYQARIFFTYLTFYAVCMNLCIEVLCNDKFDPDVCFCLRLCLSKNPQGISWQKIITSSSWVKFMKTAKIQSHIFLLINHHKMWPKSCHRTQPLLKSKLNEKEKDIFVS